MSAILVGLLMAGLRAVYGGVVFLSAFLLFLVEPMAAKQLLPVLGGSSAVWVTCLVFFQMALLLGYLYAWWMVRLPNRRRRELHVAMLAVALSALLLPVVTWHAAGSFRLLTLRGEEAAMHPVWTIFLAMAAPIGVPFVVLGSTSPLLQALLARHEGVVPYRLFALSNVGSLLALVLYPAVVEPWMTLSAQWVMWLAGFVVFVGLSGWLVWRGSVRGGVETLVSKARHGTANVLHPTLHGEAVKDGAPAMNGALAVVAGQKTNTGVLHFVQDDGGVGVGRGRRWMWFLLPMGAAMQLSAVTSHLSQDIAAIPLLWILPLATYLVTFILAFEMPGLYRRWVVGRFLAVMLASLGYALSKMDTRLPVGLAVLFFLVEIFVACWFCHAEVYRLRPAGARESTVFYLLVAAGGVAGTFFVGILSPLIFRANYDLAIAFLVTAVLAAVVTWEDGWAQRMLWCTGSVLLAALTVLLHVEIERHALMTARNFYGSLRVTAADFDDQGDMRANGDAFTGTGPVRVLMNGRIRHGMQMMEPDRRRVPTTYYGEDSGVGVALRNCCEGRAKNVGVVGWGRGRWRLMARRGTGCGFMRSIRWWSRLRGICLRTCGTRRRRCRWWRATGGRR
jgi:hypothetical protein